MRRTLAAVAASAMALAAAMPAMGSTFVALSGRQLVADAAAVVEGKVLSTHSFWGDSGRLIYTEAEVAVDAYLVGEAPAVVTVRVPGGRIGDFFVEAHGFPQLQAEQRVILFLQREEGHYTILGHQQGHFEEVTRLDGVTLAVPQIDEGATLFTPRGRLAPAPQSVEIDTFRANVRELARSTGRLAQ